MTNNELQVLQRKLKIEEREIHLKMNFSAPEGYTFPALHETPGHRESLVTNSMISHECGKDRIVMTTGQTNLSVVICDTNISYRQGRT